MNYCINCNKPTNNPKFCSKSCSATFNNKKTPKRKKTKKYFCKVCGVEIPYRRTTCDEHNKNIINWDDVTYKEIIGKRIYQKNSRIRALARKKLQENKAEKCIRCGYEKHVETCHIKPISSFSFDAKISEINSLDNLIALCPNCYWEFDNGLITIEEITSLK